MVNPPSRVWTANLQCVFRSSEAHPAPQAAPRPQDKDQEEARDETPDMGGPRDRGARGRVHKEDGEPQPHEYEGRNGTDPHEVHKRQWLDDAGGRIEQETGSQDSGDGAAGTDDGHLRSRGGNDMAG